MGAAFMKDRSFQRPLFTRGGGGGRNDRDIHLQTQSTGLGTLMAADTRFVTVRKEADFNFNFAVRHRNLTGAWSWNGQKSLFISIFFFFAPPISTPTEFSLRISLIFYLCFTDLDSDITLHPHT